MKNLFTIAVIIFVSFIAYANWQLGRYGWFGVDMFLIGMNVTILIVREALR